MEKRGEKKEKGRTHCPKSSSNLFASSDEKCTSVPFSACSFRSSLSVRLPARPPRCDCASGVGASRSAAAAPPWEGNAMRLVVEVVAADADGSTTSDSGWSQSSGDCEGWRDSDFVMGREGVREGGEPRGLIVVGVGGKAEPAFLLILVPFCRSVGLRSSAARVRPRLGSSSDIDSFCLA